MKGWKIQEKPADDALCVLAHSPSMESLIPNEKEIGWLRLVKWQIFVVYYSYSLTLVNISLI